jgi:thioredoxin 1
MAKEASMPIPNVVDGDFEKRVLAADRPVLVAFRASWCVPSQQLVSIIDEVAKQFGRRVQCFAVDTEGQTATIQRRHNVNRLPVTMLFDQGRCVDFIGGWTSKEAIADMIERRLKPVLQVDEFTFDAEVMTSRLPVLVHFDAAWCKPSQALVPVVDQAAQKFARRAKVVRVEFGPETARLCARFGVTRVPTLALFVDGRIVDQIFGGMVGGTKRGGVTTSCTGLTSFDNIAKMLEPFVL